jgi:hypothetical protein
MNCTNCGRLLAPADKVCPQCGTPRPAAAQNLAEHFRQVESEYFRLRGQLAAGRLTQQQFEAALQPLMFQDDEGRYWMIGVESGQWHMFDGRQWVQRMPPVPITTTAPLPAMAQPAPALVQSAPPVISTHARLSVLRGSANMPSLEFGREGATIGRATSNSLVVNDAQASRLHARVDYEDGKWAVRDLNSRNGTFVNGKRVTLHYLRPGDQLSVGVTVMTFEA